MVVMKHPDEDTLLRQVLELLDVEEQEELSSHLAACASCRKKLVELKRETETLGSVDPEIPEPHIEMPRRHRLLPLPPVRAAAVLLIGFLAGFGIARLSTPPEILFVTGFRSTPQPLQSITDFVVCESENLAVDERN